MKTLLRLTLALVATSVSAACGPNGHEETVNPGDLTPADRGDPAAVHTGDSAAIGPGDFVSLVEFYSYRGQLARSATRSGESESMPTEPPPNYDIMAEIVETARAASPLPEATRANLDSLKTSIETAMAGIDIETIVTGGSWDEIGNSIQGLPEANVDDPIIGQAMDATVALLADPEFQAAFVEVVRRQEQQQATRSPDRSLVDTAVGIALDMAQAAIVGAIEGAATAAGTAYEEGASVVDAAGDILEGAVGGAADAVGQVIIDDVLGFGEFDDGE